MLEYKFKIPECYIFLAEESVNPKKLYVNYARGYLKKSFPDFVLIRISQQDMICVRKDEYFQNPKQRG